MSRIRGSYPDGPRRDGAPDEDRPARTPRLEPVGEREERLGRASQARVQRRRARRIWSGLVVALATAGGTGFYLGVRGHRSSEQLTAERNAPRSAAPFDPSFETNRVLMELWRMEDDEIHGTKP